MFSGKAVTVEYQEDDRDDREPKIGVTFQVYRVWKGAVGRRVVLRTIYNKWTCSGYYFKADNEYPVVAYEQIAADEKSGLLKELGGVNPCGGTLPGL